ncbi:uncharacterized protein LOC107464730 [Arachis duranensis]|uniref:Uncharacterized protein LOC107464730 n=1 Tax=Arachis duranensis TaxID=130453 RepID=A0A9C6TKZ5_ARADU|nr:uncharacterized protein LOC107464730 [Arachis duranensis]
MSQPTGTSFTIGTVNIPDGVAPQKKGCWSKIFDWFKYDRNEWLKDMRGGLSLMVSIIATITFQSALNPPGGVLQAGLGDKSDILNCLIPDSQYSLCAGEAVLSVTKREYYTFFLVFNTTCFIASLCVCLLLVSGLPLKNRFTMWLLLVAMCITVTSLLLAYLMGLFLATPEDIAGGEIFDKWFSYLLLGFFILFVGVGIFQVLRFLIWCVKKCIPLKGLS